MLEKFRNGNSADAKKLWFAHCSDINVTADEGIKSFGIYSDAAMMANKLEESQRSCHGQTASKQHCINVCNVYTTLFKRRLTIMCPLRSVFGSFEITHRYDSCSNREFLWKLPTKKDVVSVLNIDILNDAFLSKKERCPGSFIRRNVLTVASQFLVVYGDGSALKTYRRQKHFQY